jgi:outer membrane protein assembly factor BamB
MLARPRALRRAPHVIVVGALVASAVVWSSSAATAATAAPADQWTSTGAGGGQARVNAGERVLISGHLQGLHDAWSQIVQFAASAPPTIVGGVAYTTVESLGVDGPTDYSAVIARNAVTGAVKWQTFLPNLDQANGGFGVADSGGVLVEPVDSPDLNPGLIGLDPKTGRILWEQHFPSYGTVNGFAANDGIVFAQNGNTLQARNPTTGALLWSVNTLAVTKYFEQYGAIGDGIAAGDHAVFVDTSYGLYSFNDATGHVMWSADIQASSNSDRIGSVAAGGGHVYVSGTQVEAFTENGCGKSTCTPVWINRVGNPTDVVGGGLMFIGAITSTTLAVSAAPYTTPASVVLASLSATTGATRWTAKTTKGGLAFPIQGGNLIWQQVGLNVEAFPINCAKVCLPAATINASALLEIGGLSVGDGSLFIQSTANELDAYRN